MKFFWGCFLMSGVRMLHFSKDRWKFIQIHQYYTMALSFYNALLKVFGELSTQNSTQVCRFGVNCYIWVIYCKFAQKPTDKHTISPHWLRLYITLQSKKVMRRAHCISNYMYQRISNLTITNLPHFYLKMEWILTIEVQIVLNYHLEKIHKRTVPKQNWIQTKYAALNVSTETEFVIFFGQTFNSYCTIFCIHKS